ncbi:hypothetical protein [Pelagibaculum spongiae]|uniref:hypothetical protein n=1 Tax=Pelagibaculum spongiae TaxID=2080658 RepID=UPI0010576DA0|nr:hypothetical protein [Pelagibaculum spongiae]
MDGFAKSEVGSFVNATNGLKKGYKPGKTLYLSHQTETGYQRDKFKFSLLYRQDYAAWFDSDTAAFYRAVHNKKIPLEKREYLIDLQAKGIISSGVKFGYQFDFKGLDTLGVDVSFLQIRYLEDINLNGTGYGKSKKSYDYSIFADQKYSEDLLFGREVENTYGYGATLDLYGSWRITRNWQVDFLAKDIISHLKWDQLAYTKAIASDKNSSTGDDGVKSWNPTLSGTESYLPDTTIKLNKRVNVSSSYHWHNWSNRIGIQYMAKDYLVNYGIAYQGKCIKYQADLWIENKALELSIRHKNLYMALATNGTPDTAELIKFSLGIYY